MPIHSISARQTALYLYLLGTAATLSFMPFGARAQQSPAAIAPTLQPADSAEKADGTLGPAAEAMIKHGPLPFSDADVAAKTAANRAREEAEQKSTQRPFCLGDLAGEAGAGPLTPVIVGVSTSRVWALIVAALPIRPARSDPRALFRPSTHLQPHHGPS